MIERKFTTTFTIKRQAWTTEVVGSETIDKSDEVSIGTFNGYRQQSSSDYVQSLGLEVTKPHIVWCGTEVNIIEGDIIESIFGNDKVRAVQVNRDGINTHKELIVEALGETLV